MRASRRKAGPAGKRRQGSVAIVVAFMMVVLAGFSALVVDVGNIFRIRNELQNAADAVALAGARYLDGTSNGISAARTVAWETAMKHLANNADVDLDQYRDITFGYWDSNKAAENGSLRPNDEGYQEPYTDYGTNPANPAQTNAVRIRTMRAAENGDPVQHFFAPLLGFLLESSSGDLDQSDQIEEAIAVGGGRSNACGFPLVVGECSLGNSPIDGICEYCLVMKDDLDDTAGWTSFAANGGVGQKDIADAITAACFKKEGGHLVPNIDASGACPRDCDGARAGQEIQVQNGNFFTKSGSDSGKGKGGGGGSEEKAKTCELIQALLTRDPAGPKSFRIMAPVLDTQKYSKGNCNDAFKGKERIAGYAELEILAAKCGTADTNPPRAPGWDTIPGCGEIPSDKYMIAKLHCDAEPAGPSGGGFFGADARNMRLVH